MKTKLVLFFLGIMTGATGVWVQMNYVSVQNHTTQYTGALREEITNYRYIDPLLACNSPEMLTGYYKELDNELSKVINKDKADGKTDAVSLYFQEYPSGRWVGIDENHRYAPASMLKIVLMIAYFKEEMEHPGTLKNVYLYSNNTAQINSEIPFAATSSLVIGHTYNIEQLIRSMIIDSDNGAMNILLTNISDERLDDVYQKLHVPDPSVESGEYTISPKSYSLFFRVLYNATYLSRELSENAMGILAEATYDGGIVRGIPKNITIAHKFGEHVNSDSDGDISSVELHDCGVVYGPNLPFFLCIMTSGKTIEGLQSTIQDLSSTTFEFIDIKKYQNSFVYSHIF